MAAAHAQSTAPSTTTSKRIFIFSDGTSKNATTTQAGSQSNVVRLAESLSPTDLDHRVQKLYYQQGLGTSHNIVDKITQLAIADGIDDNIMIIYNAICSEWKVGDVITFCGFSRGAFTVRCVANFVAEMGILPAAEMPKPNWTAQAEQAYKDWKGTEIDCVGVFDTVSSVNEVSSLGGHPERDPLVAKARNMNISIKFAFQALALNEEREDFQPEIWPGPNGSQTMKQTWFVGQHSDIGGGPKAGTPNNMLQDAALRWMIALMHDSCRIGFAIDNPEMNNMFKVPDVGDLNQGEQNPGGFPTNLPPPSIRQPGVQSPTTELVHISVRETRLTNLDWQPPLTKILGEVSETEPFKWTRTGPPPRPGEPGRLISLGEDKITALLRQDVETDRTAKAPVHVIPSVSNKKPGQVPQPAPADTVGGIRGPIPTTPP